MEKTTIVGVDLAEHGGHRAGGRRSVDPFTRALEDMTRKEVYRDPAGGGLLIVSCQERR